MKNDGYTKTLKEKYGSVMTAFPALANKEIDMIAEYINKSGEASLVKSNFLFFVLLTLSSFMYADVCEV